MAELQTMTVNGLVKKRAELAGRIIEADTKLSALRADLSHVEASIRIFDPEYKLERIKAKAPLQQLAFNRGELIRDVLDILRTADKPMSVAEMATGLITRKAMPDDRGVREFVESRVDKALRRQEGKAVQKVVFGPRAVG